MFEAGKIHNTVKDMNRLRVDVMGVNELRWPGSGECQIGDHLYIQGVPELTTETSYTYSLM